MYWFLCVMKRHNMNKADKIISNSRAEKCKILIEKSQNDESGE